MEIVKKQEGKALNVAVIGKLDTNTAPQLREDVADKLDGIDTLTFDMADMEYVSSAGLRVLLACQKTMNAQGKMTLKNVKPEIMTIFKATGFTEFLTFA